MRFTKNSLSNTPPAAGSVTPPADHKPARRKRRRWRVAGLTLLILVMVLGVGRAMLPWAVRDYVNHTLARDPLYSGAIGDVQIHLWRGAYSIRDIRLSKSVGDTPVPLFRAKRIDLSIQWNAVLHGRFVGQIVMDEPEINIVDAPSAEASETGGGGPWLEMLRDLFPFEINRAEVREGSVHFRAYNSARPVDVYLSHLSATIDNLSNVSDETTPLNATVRASATAMDQAKLDFKMVLNPSSYRPTFHLVLRLLGLDVTQINDLALAYGKFDFKRGWFDLVLDTDCKEGQMTGYVKPLFRNLKVFSLAQDLKQDNALQFFWQSVIGAATSALKNHPRDQLGTLIPFHGDATGATTVGILATIGNLFHNAFVRAYLPELEVAPDTSGNLHFEAPDFTTAMAIDGETQ